MILLSNDMDKATPERSRKIGGGGRYLLLILHDVLTNQPPHVQETIKTFEIIAYTHFWTPNLAHRLHPRYRSTHFC